jgi:hypothetical protein
MVYSGKLLLIYTDQPEQEISTFLFPGDHFGEEALLTGVPLSYTVKASENSVVLKMHSQDFDAVLEEIPLLEERLVATAGSRKISHKKSAKWIQTGETTLLVCRRHWIFLLSSIFWPSVLLGVALAVTAYTFVNYTQIGLFCSSVAATFGLIWLIWRVLDWLNDYSIVTSRRVISLEKVIGIYDNRTEAPLNSVIANDVTRSFLGQIFDYGDVIVRSYMGNLILTGVPQPKRMVEVIERYKSGVQYQNRNRELKQIDEDVQSMFKSFRQRPGWDAVQPMPMPKSPAKEKSVFGDVNLGMRLRTLFMMRFENQDVITYRRHWYSLVGRIWWLVLLLFFISGISTWISISGATFLTGCSLGALIDLILWLVIGYRIWDWSNDIFQLTKSQIIDIDKKPLGAEGKKTAPLDAPDFRIEHVRPSLLANLFNYGNVIVYIGQTQFNIEGVYNPDQVHNEVAARRQALLAQKDAERETRERGRMMDWLKAFYLHSQEMNNDESGLAGME